MNNCFVAIDFETANYNRNSACSVGVVRVENGKIVDKKCSLINPNTYFIEEFTKNIHGISADDVKDAPGFDVVWKDFAPMLEGTQFFAAHNAPFDRSVLEESCKIFDLDIPKQQFVCTLKVARKQWTLDSYVLCDVCDYLCIPLKHHEALSDACGCAEVLLRATKEGYKVQ